jgi:DNA-binding NarL/FixJ family response regulator
MIKVLIVDDLGIFRDTLKYRLDHDSEIEVVGTAANGFEALEKCKNNTPDIVLMDIIMPVCDGIDGTGLIKEQFPDIRIIMLTTFDDSDKISSALKKGADTYVLKDIELDELIKIIKSLSRGFNVVQKEVFDKMVKNITDQPKGDLIQEASLLISKLSSREIDIIKMVVDGKSNAEIGRELFISEGSVRNCVSLLFKKLELKDRVQLAVFAVRNKIV